MFHRRFRGVASLTLLVVFLVAACGGSKPTAPAPETGDSGANQPKLGGTLRFAMTADPDVLNPYFGRSAYGFYVTTPVFGSGLLQVNEQHQPVPWMAKAYNHSDDNLTWTFTLRDDIKFQDGQPLTADDVVFSYHIPMDKEYTGIYKSDFDEVKEVSALDPRTVQIILKEPYAPLLLNTATRPILPKHAFPAGISVKDMATHPFSKKPIGAGPFKFVDWKTGQYVEMEANPDFFLAKEGKGPFIQTVRIKIISETQVAVAALEAGEIDLYGNMEAQFVDRFKTDFKDRLIAYDWERRGFGFITLNNERFPTNIKAVRLALTMALNRDAIIKGPLDNKAVVPAGPIPPASWAYDRNVKGIGYDPAAARKLLDEAGIKLDAKGVRSADGKPLVLEYAATKGSPLIEAIALQAKKDWTDLGFQVTVNFVEFNTLLEKYLEPGDFNATFSGFNLSVDPDSFYNIYHSSQAKKNDQGLVMGNNNARYINPASDKLLEEARHTFDTEKRKQLYSEFQRLVIEDAPHIWIYANHYTDFASKRVKGVVNVPGSGADLDFLYRWYIDEQ